MPRLSDREHSRRAAERWRTQLLVIQRRHERREQRIDRALGALELYRSLNSLTLTGAALGVSRERSRQLRNLGERILRHTLPRLDHDLAEINAYFRRADAALMGKP